jgi:hypothetical protein
MAFPNAQVDLSSFIYKLQDLETARTVMQRLITRLIPEWIDAPVGVMAQHWNSDYPPGVLHIIDIAKTLHCLSCKITDRSRLVFDQKVIQLLKESREFKYEELLAELRVGTLFGELAGPISFEPMVPIEKLESADKPSSPDYGIRLPDGDVVIEVTTLRVDKFDRWEIAMTGIRERIGNAISEANLMKEVDIQAPFGIQAHLLTRTQLDILIDLIRSKDSGEESIKLGQVDIQVIWRKIPVIRLDSMKNFQDQLNNIEIPEGNFSMIVASDNMKEPQNAKSTRVYPVLGPETDELIFKSLRNCLDGKRSQIPPGIPSLLVIQLGGWRISPEYIYRIITKRVWPNKLYERFTGIGLFVPQRTFELTSPVTTLTVNWNIQPLVPATSTLLALVEGGARFYHGKLVSSPNNDSTI